MKNKVGLIQRIKNATSASQVNALLAEGKGYELASSDTRRKWQRAARARNNILERMADAA